MDTTRGSFDGYVARLRAREPFAFSRWGDGEWSALLGREGTNVDGQRYTKRLREDLEAVLLDRPAYDLALQPMANRMFGVEIQAWLTSRQLAPAWVNADVFAKHSIVGTLAPLCDALATRAVVMVSPAYLRALALFPMAGAVDVPERGGYRVVSRIEHEIYSTLTDLALDRPVVAVSAGMAAKLLVHRLVTQDPTLTVMDFGSLWDPYVGRVTRTYHQKVVDREEALRG